MHEAIALIEKKIGTVLRQSSFHETEPWGFESPNLFLNACVCVSTSLAPRQLLETTQAIEREMGRVKKSINAQYTDRIIDIDILLYDKLTSMNQTLSSPTLLWKNVTLLCFH